MLAESDEAQTQDSAATLGMEGVKAARIADYKVLVARQWQLAENLSVLSLCVMFRFLFYFCHCRSACG